MKKEELLIKRGFTLVEVLLATAILAMITSVVIGGLIYGRESFRLAGNRTRAVLLAEEGLEAVRNIRDEDFTNLDDGTHGLRVQAGEWRLFGSSDDTGLFTRSIDISTVDDDRKKIVSNVVWQQNAQRTGTVVLTTYLTNWTAPLGPSLCSVQADNLSVDTSIAELTNGNRQLRYILIENTAADCSIVVSEITVVWQNTNEVTRVRIAGTSVWTGNELTGTLLDIDDTTLDPASGLIESRYAFNGNMNGEVFDITFHMSDGTTKTESGIVPL